MASVRLLAVFCICLLISSVSAIFVSRSELNKHGYISDDSHLPECIDGRRIKLLSYSYEFECGIQTCSKAPDEQLSISAVAVIHRMCSLKLKCAKQESSLVESQENITMYLKISYSCLGFFDTFVNICENATFTSENTKPIHLTQVTNDGNPKRLEKCECSVRGRFQLTLADVRLRSAADPNNCSPAQLRVNFKNYECDQMARTVGSVFKKTAIGTLTDAAISYTTNSAIEEPEMIYLTVKPEGQQTEVSCVHYPRFISPSTIELMQTEEVATDMYKYDQEKAQSASTASQSVAMVAVGVGVTLAIVLVVVFLRRRKQRKKKCRLDRLERLVETQLTQSQRLQQHGNRSCGEYSFARDDKTTFTGGGGDYVDLVEAPKAAQHGRGAECLDECDVKARNTHLESKRVSARKINSTSGRLKKCISKTPKQETPIYSYAMHEPLLRNAQETSNDKFTSEKTNQSSVASDGQNGRFYFKLEPQQTTESGSRSGATTVRNNDKAEKVRDTISNTNVFSKMKKKGKHHIESCEDDVSASRCKDTEVYNVSHYAVPVVDATKHDDFKEHKTVPSGPSINAPDFNLPNGNNVYANERGTTQSGADKYETIDISRSVVPQANDSQKSKSQGVLDKILSIKIFKSSEQKPANPGTTKILNRNVEEIEDVLEKDSRVESQGETGDINYDYATNLESGHSDPSNDHFDGPKVSKTKGFFGKKKLKAKSSTSKEVSKKETKDSPQSTERAQSAVLPWQQDGQEADEDHYDKLITDNVVQKHPNYDKVPVTQRSLTLKIFKT